MSKNKKDLVGKAITIVKTFSKHKGSNTPFFGRTGVIKSSDDYYTHILLDGEYDIEDNYWPYRRDEFVLNEDQLNRPVIVNPDYI